VTSNNKTQAQDSHNGLRSFSIIHLVCLKEDV